MSINWPEFNVKIVYQIGKSEYHYSFEWKLGKESLSQLQVEMIEEEAPYGKRLRILLHTEKAFTLKSLKLVSSYDYQAVQRIYCNGFQSWTVSREYKKTDKIEGLRAVAQPLLSAYGDYDFYSYPNEKGKLHGWNYTYLRYSDEEILLMASLDESNAYTLFTQDTINGKLGIAVDIDRVKFEKGEEVLDLYIAYGAENSLFEEWQKLAKWQLKAKAKPVTGWTSWYNYYTHITPEILNENIAALKTIEAPIDIFQIDDGWQEKVGDWVPNEKFKNKMQPLVADIHAAKLKAGLWLAPFICEEKSAIFKEQKDWLLKDKNGKPVKAGFNPAWSNWFYVLDIYHEGFRAYLRYIFDTVLNRWEFDFVKLDFLYAAALIERPEKSRGAVMHDAMKWLRELAKGKQILGCGVPLASSFGLVDYCRIGADIHLDWEMNLLKAANNRERVSTINSLLSTIHRRHLNKAVFGNDPDVFILRDKNNKLNSTQRYTIYLINQIFGQLIFCSDNVSAYDDKTKALYLSQFPFKDKQIHSVDQRENIYQIHFSIGDLEYLACCNLGEKKAELDDLKGAYYQAVNPKILVDTPIKLKPYQSKLLLSIEDNKVALAGGNAHLFPSSNIKTWSHKDRSIQFKLAPKSTKAGELWFKVPNEWKNVLVNGQELATQIINGLNIVKVKLSK